MKQRHTKKVIRKIEKHLIQAFIKFFAHFKPNSDNEYILPLAYDRDYPTLRARFDKLLDLSKEELEILSELHVYLYLLLGWQLKLKPTWSNPLYVDGVNYLVLTKCNQNIIKIVGRVVWGTLDYLQIKPFQGKIITNKAARKIIGYSFLLGDSEKQFMISYLSQAVQNY